MTIIADPPVEIETMSDLLERLGDVPPSRVLMKPAPGMATVQDVIDVHDRTDRICELVDGTLVEKGMGLKESVLAGVIIAVLRAFVVPRNLGLVTGESAAMRLFADLVRIPDAAYISWDRIPGRRMPTEPVPRLAPNLAAEVLSKSNTRAEMDRKLREYFKAGVELVWIIDPKTRGARAYISPDDFISLTESDSLDGGPPLPGFTLALHDVFAELDRIGQP